MTDCGLDGDRLVCGTYAQPGRFCRLQAVVSKTLFLLSSPSLLSLVLWNSCHEREVKRAVVVGILFAVAAAAVVVIILLSSSLLLLLF